MDTIGLKLLESSDILLSYTLFSSLVFSSVLSYSVVKNICRILPLLRERFNKVLSKVQPYYRTLKYKISDILQLLRDKN